MSKNRSERWCRLAADLRVARFSQACALTLLVVQGLVWFLGQPNWIYIRFGLSRPGIEQGRLWQLVTHIFLHGPWWEYAWHLLLNAAVLLIAGSRMERIAGPVVLLKVFFAGTFVGGLAQLAATPDPTKILFGASGGIFAVVFWMLTIQAGERMWPVPVSGRNLAIGLFLAEASFLVTAWLWPGSGLGIFGSACHLGGAITGWLFARRALGPTITREDLLKERQRRESPGGP